MQKNGQSCVMTGKKDGLMYNSNRVDIGRLQHGNSRSITAENPTGERGNGGKTSSALGVGRKGRPCIDILEPGQIYDLATISGSGEIRHIWMTVTDRTAKDYFVLSDLVLRMYWDDSDIPSVECPLGDFFCCGFAREARIESLPVVVNPRRGFNMYLPMPFNKKARITIENQHETAVPGFFYQIDYVEFDDVQKDIAYFHAIWRRERITQQGVDFVINDEMRGMGHYIGTYMALTTLERYWWGEGEFKFYIDEDEEYPTICGTGTEDYFGGAWSFASFEQEEMYETTYSTPFLGYPYYSKKDDIYSDYHNNDVPVQRGLYRWHLMDPVMFKKRMKVTVQQMGSSHQGLFERQDDVACVSYWYQDLPSQVHKELEKKEYRWPR